eukprot:gene68356-biopygen50268
MLVVGLPYVEQRQMGLDEIKGGSPYGASTIAGGNGERQPSAQELEMARFQGRHVATIAIRIRGATLVVSMTAGFIAADHIT